MKIEDMNIAMADAHCDGTATENHGEPDLVDLMRLEEERAGEDEATVPDLTQFDDAMKLYMRDVQKTRLLSAAEERELAVCIAAGDKSARDRMIESNLRLVVKEATRYRNRDMPFLDLIEEGNLALLKAAEKFDPSRGCRFSTYATWWIRQGIERAIIDKERAVRLPVHVFEDVRKMAKISRRLLHTLSREPSAEEVATEMGEDIAYVRRLMVSAGKIHSMDHPLGEEEDYTLLHTIEDASNVPAAEHLESLDTYELALHGIRDLSDMERNILALRFGLDDKEPQTLNTIGRMYGVTRERVRQIESRALQKLRKCCAEIDLQSAGPEEKPLASA